MFDIRSGKESVEPLRHTKEIEEVALSQHGNHLERKLAFIDRNRDLFVTTLNGGDVVKLSTVVSSVKWNDSTDILLAIADGKISVWYYPYVVFVDRDLLPMTKQVNDDMYSVTFLKRQG